MFLLFLSLPSFSYIQIYISNIPILSACIFGKVAYQSYGTIYCETGACSNQRNVDNAL